MTFRTLLRRVHLCLGLTLGLYAAVMGATGSLLVFRDELTRPKFLTAPGQMRITTTPDQALNAVRAAYPGWQPLTVTWPNQECTAWMLYVLRGSEAREVYVDVQTAAIAGERDPASGWVGWIARLHTSLRAGRVGRSINGWGALGLMLMSITGLILWSTAVSRFRVDWRADWRTLSWQLHHAAGIVAMAYVFLLGLTGTYLIWYQPYVAAASRFLGRSPDPSPLAVRPGARLLTLEALARIVENQIPGGSIHRMQVANSADQPVRVTLREGAPAEFHLVDTVFLDPVTGAVVKKIMLDSRPAGDSVLGWLSALHFGIFGGIGIRVLWAVLALALPLLAVTGFLMWLRS